MVLNLDAMIKIQSDEHNRALTDERNECNVRMTALQAEIEILKRRMSDEESR